MNDAAAEDSPAPMGDGASGQVLPFAVSRVDNSM